MTAPPTPFQWSLPLEPNLVLMVPVQALLRRVAQILHTSLRAMLTQPSKPFVPSDKRRLDMIGLVQHAHRVLARLAVVLVWARHHSSAALAAQATSAHLHSLHHIMHSSILSLAPISSIIHRVATSNRNLDVPSAILVLASGSYPLLPLALSNLPDDHIQPSSNDTDPALLDHLNDTIKSRMLLYEPLIPAQFWAHYYIDRGLVSFSVPNEFSVTLSLPGGPDPTVSWNLIQAKLLDPSLHLDPAQTHQLVEIGNAKLQFCPNDPTPDPTALALPLVDLYYTFHHFLLSLRLEHLFFQFNTRDSSQVALSSVGDAQYSVEQSRISLDFWLGSFNKSTLQISIQETTHTVSFNASIHPAKHSPPTAIPARCKPGPLARQSVLQYHAAELIFSFNSFRTTVPARTSLNTLIDWCMKDQASMALQTLASTLSELNGRFQFEIVSQKTAAASSITDQLKQCGGSIVFPMHGVAVSVHFNSGNFVAQPLDQSPKDFHLVAMALNRDPTTLKEALFALHVSQRLEEFGSSLLLHGLHPVPKSDDTFVVQLLMKSNVGLSSRAAWRAFQFPHDPEYWLVMSVGRGDQMWAVVINRSRKALLHTYQASGVPSVDNAISTDGQWQKGHLVIIFKQHSLLNRTFHALQRSKIPVQAVNANLVINPRVNVFDASHVSSVLAFMVVSADLNQDHPLMITIGTYLPVAGLSSRVHRFSYASVSDLVKMVHSYMQLFQLLGDVDPDMPISVDLHTCRAIMDLPSSDNLVFTTGTAKSPATGPFSCTNAHVSAVLDLISTDIQGRRPSYVVAIASAWSRISEGCTKHSFPRLMIKLMTLGSVMFDKTALMHVRLIYPSLSVVFRFDHWCPTAYVLSTLATARSDLIGRLRVFDNDDSEVIICEAEAVSAFLDVLVDAYKESQSLVDVLTFLIDPPSIKSPGTESWLSLTNERVVVSEGIEFRWGSIVFHASVGKLESTMQGGKQPMGIMEHELSVSEQGSLAGFVCQSWEHTMKTSDTDREVLFRNLLRGVRKFLHLPQVVLRSIAKALDSIGGTLVLISPLSRNLSKSVCESLPAHPELCILVHEEEIGADVVQMTSQKGRAVRDLNLSVVFGIPAHNTNMVEYVPLVYSCSEDVVSPWESAAKVNKDDEPMNPSALLALLGSKTSETDREMSVDTLDVGVHEPDPPVYALLTEIKAESLRMVAHGDRLVWTMAQIMSRRARGS